MLQRLGNAERALPDWWVQAVTFDGNQYPLGLNTTMGSEKDEPPDSSFPSFVSWAYKAAGPVFAAIAVRMRVFSEARFQWRRFDQGRPGPLFGTPELSVLERPWPGGTTGGLLMRMEQDGSLAGNNFYRRIRRRGRGVDRLVRLRPDWVTIALGSEEDADHPALAADTTVLGFQYQPGGLNADRPSQFFLPDEVSHYAPTPDPDATFRGMSWLTPVIREISGDKLATTHKTRFYENASTPNLAIKFDPSINKKQIEEFKEVAEAEHRGAWNAYKTMYLGGGADPVVLGRDFKQMDFRNVQGIGETRIFEAAEVHAVIVGSAEGMQGSALNAGNFAQVRRRFADGTMRPLWREAAASLEVLLDRPTGAELWYEDRDIPFLRQDAKDEAEIKKIDATTARTLTDGGWTPDSVKEYVATGDVNVLKHSGKLSVQLLPDGDPAGTSEGDDGN